MPIRLKGRNDMTRLTEEEAARLDEYYTNNTVDTDPSRPGFFARQKGMTVTVDEVTARYLKDKAIATKHTPAEVISDMVQKAIAAGQ